MRQAQRTDTVVIICAVVVAIVGIVVVRYYGHSLGIVLVIACLWYLLADFYVWLEENDERASFIQIFLRSFKPGFRWPPRIRMLSLTATVLILITFVCVGLSFYNT